MNKTNDYKFNLPTYSDPVDIEDLNDNFRGIDDALMAGLCKKDYTGNNMGSSDPSARKYAWAPWFEIVNDNEFDVVVTDRNAPVESEEATINIAAGQTFRKYINGRYYMNFYVQDQHDVTFKWFTNAETYINESGGGGGGTGTVTSVSVQGGSGSHLTASGNPIETSGTITINVDEGYSIPSDNEQTAWDGKAADLKAEIDSSTYVLTLQLKDSSGNLIGSERTIDLPLETMVVDGEYDPQTKKIKLELKNGNYVEFSVADLVSGLQTELSASNKLDPDYIDYDSSHRAVSDTEKSTWNGKQNALTFDDTPTQNSNNPVKSGGVYSALAGKQASLDQTQLAAVNSGIDSSKVGQISTNQTNILYTQESTIGENVIPYPYYRSSGYTEDDVIYTYDNDGIININGTASNDSYFVLANSIHPETIGDTFTISTASDNVNSAVKYRCYYVNDAGEGVGGNIVFGFVNSVASFTYNPPENYSKIAIAVYLVKNTGAINEKITIMLEKGSVAHPYQPYKLSRQNLYNTIPSMSVSNSKTLTTSEGYCYLTDWTKNLLNVNLDLCKKMNPDRTWDGNSCTYRGVTYTVDDATHAITFDGTSSSSSTSRIYLSPVFETSKYSDCWAVGVNSGDTGVGFGFTYCQNPDGSTWMKDEIDQGVGTKVNTEYPYFRVMIKVEKGHTADNLSVQPMFMEGTTPHAYVPYDGYDVTSSNSDGTETHSVFVGTETPSPAMLKTYDSSTLITSSGEIEVVIPNNTKAKAITNSDVTTQENRNALVEVIDDNAKNLIPFPYSVESRTQRGITFLPDSKGVIHITGTNDGTGNSYFPLIAESTPIPILEDGETYMLVCNVTGTGTINAVYMNESRNGSSVTLGNITLLSAGKYAIPVTYRKESGDAGETCAIKITSGSYSGEFDLYISIMVCKKALYDISQNVVPHALPNTDLTYRQSEDREDINGLLESVDNWFDTTLCHGIETNQMISRVDVDSSITISTKSGATGNTDGYETKMLIDITEFPSGSFTLWLDFISGTVAKQWLGFRITMLDENMNVIPSAQLYKYKSANNTGLHKIGTISVQALIDSGVRYFRPVIWISATNPYSNAKFKVYVTDGELTPSDQGYNISRIGLENHINNIDVENLLPFPYSFSSYTRSDADIVVDDDGAISITSNGALASDIRLNLIPNTPNTPNSMLPLEVGKQYVYDAGTELGSNDPEYTAFVELWESPTASTRKSAITLAKDYLDDTKIVFTADAPYCRCYIKLHSGYTTDGTVTYRPTFKKGTAESSCVPYNQSRLALRTDMNKLLCAPTLVTTGSLDNFTDTSFCAVDSNVSGKPTGVTGNCFVRTSKMSDTYIMQECFSASGAYYRIYDTNTWSVWMQLSNV